MNTNKRRAITLVSAVLLVTATGCSTKAEEGGGDTTSEDGVKIGRGIEGDTISLGSLTDLTGVFAALGADITNAQALYWKTLNAGDKICGTYSVDEIVKDHGYDTQRGIQLYSSFKEDVLAIEQTIGSPINTGLAQQLEADSMVNIPGAWAQSLTEVAENTVVGSTYEVEMINVLDYLLEEGEIEEGAKIGHIYFEGEYGEGGLAGSEFFAEQHDMEVVEVQIQPTDTDMTAQVTKLESEGVDVIAITVAPGQTASIAGVAAASGLDVPIAGNNPVYAPGLLDTPAGDALKANLYVASPVAPFDQKPEILKAYQAEFDNDPTLGVMFGFAAADVMRQILEKACDDGDLTPEGVLAAKESIGTVDTGGIAVPLEFIVGESPSNASYIFKADDVPGGAVSVSDLYEGDDVAAFVEGG
ncbi:lipoprotein [Nocardioides psychrotolerans]|uniref:ABC-type branched-chain amino acid transport system, substrate-binding protein n=1 Tax=Nocardioides psychrotolerans TaxID=1005945 RepID=A0A1I3RCI4_9ACTN|nr:ABC transporter substrate-binding protein [Nocardioides psychrotolerans]GEP40438.1 lipoprotein [Nocardioides psychrotolerans]SFJ44364.1 ABC-type branched-chain amino acid transport system, substrate-binding protein [Nocardioides psychrotolerans]